MFRETITHQGGTTNGNASEAHAMLILRRAVTRGYTIDASTDGGATVSWTARRFGVGTQVIEAPRSIELVPHLPVGNALTVRTCEDLLLIDSERHPATYDPEARVITGGIWRIPPAASARLRARGLVHAGDDNSVRLTLVTRLALIARDHRTRTTEPEGWHRPGPNDPPSAGLNKPGRRAGMLHSSASVAICECGEFSRHCGDREEARRAATAHRRDEFTTYLKLLTAAPTPV
ncbi:hypothetical protein [Streptomyces sp. NPDC053560]|uniref:hypothetical protein n=1 Tax=Streptomyces sp. NPDC053560 TaxID=3365711 RepID=UPI0037D3AAFA